MMDEYFVSLQAAMHGSYVPFSTPLHPRSANDKANRELDSFAHRAAKAMSNYRDRKGRR